jgi:hypothetical protein
MTAEFSIPSEDEIDDALSSLDESDRQAVDRCVSELDEMVDEYGPDLLLMATMVVSARLAREETLN